MLSERQKNVTETLSNAHNELKLAEDWIRTTKRNLEDWNKCGHVNEEVAKKNFVEIEAAIEEAKYYVAEVKFINEK